MTKYTLSLVLFISMLIPIASKSQNANSEINTDNINYKILSDLFLKKLNQLRSEKDCTPLFEDKILAQAAKDQADYMFSINQLSHNQKTKEKENPQKRVFYYKGTHDQVGENCIKIYLKKPMFDKKTKKTSIANTYEQATHELFIGWKNSPGHYKNMITKGYDVEGLGYAFNKDSSILYVAQVFGAKPFVPISGVSIPTDAFGIKERNENVCKCMEEKTADKVFETFQLAHYNDSIAIRCEDLQAMKALFNHPNDAIYIDIVIREQFPCEKNNLLHGSPVFDGVMLKPVLFKTIFKNNKAHDGKNLLSPFCKVPEQFENYKYNINYGIVKQGFSCRYVWPSSAPSQNLEILQLYPKWLYEEGKKVLPDTFDGVLDFIIPFERGKTELNKKDELNISKKLEIYKPYIKNVSVNTYSSVEGNSDMNIKLQEKRATSIVNLIKKQTDLTANFDIEAKENWDDFFMQIKNTPFEYLHKLPAEEIKNRLKGKPLLDSIDFILKRTRTAKISISLKAIISDSSSAYLILAAYKKSLKNNDSLRAFNYQNKLLECAFANKFAREEINQLEVPLSKKFLPVWTNHVASAITDSGYIYSNSTRNKLLKAAALDTNYLPMQFNLSIMSLKYLHLYYDTLIPVKELENKMNKCFKMGNTKIDSILVYHMFLNYSILSAYNHWIRYEYDKIDRHLLNIKKYYPSAQITEYEALRLGLLFNLYARYSWTSELVLPYLRKNTNNEDLTFLFIETYGGSNGGSGLKEEEWIKYLKRAKSMNPGRFYKWINNSNFQYLRYETIKKEFCELKDWK